MSQHVLTSEKELIASLQVISEHVLSDEQFQYDLRALKTIHQKAAPADETNNKLLSF